MYQNKRIKVKVATSNIRGFLAGLFEYPFQRIEFVCSQKNVYQVFHRHKQLLYYIYRRFCWIVPFQIIKVSNEGQDINFSYNRFLKSDQPYVIYLENPSALVNYSWQLLLRNKFSRRIKKCLSDKNLKAIICMSQACRETLSLYYQIPEHIKIDMIYPLIREDPHWDIGRVCAKVETEKIECLFVSQEFRLKGGEDVVETILRLKKENCPIHLTIITKQDNISTKYREKIFGSKCIDVVEFGMDKEQLNGFYKKAAILLHPSRWDSSALVVLEAMKYGCALITTDLYALKEMVSDGINGYLLKPYYRDWNEDNTPNIEVAYHHNKTISSGFIDEDLIDNMYRIIKDLNYDRQQLKKICVNSYEKAVYGAFSEASISEAWKSLLEDIK